MRVVVLLDQRSRIDPDNLGHASDMTARVEVTAARREIVVLNPADDRFPDPRPLAHLRNAQTGVPSGPCQGIADTHAIPPLPRRSPNPGSKSRHLRKSQRDTPRIEKGGLGIPWSAPPEATTFIPGSALRQSPAC